MPSTPLPAGTMRVTITGTGTPTPRPDRAGSGVLVEVEGLRLQFDAGRSTAMRLAAAAVAPGDLDAVFLTHHHSDHVVGLADLAISRWVVPHERRGTPLPVVAPEGPSVTFAREMLQPFEADLAIRQEHTGRESRAAVEVLPFDAGAEPAVVWSRGDVTVTSVLVDHGPVVPSVGYRVDVPGASVVISGDCRPCEGVRLLSAGASLLVHEAMLGGEVASGPYAPIGNYHTDCVDLGELAQEVGVPRLVLTHLIPQPHDRDEAERFLREVRAGGYRGHLVVAEDLTVVDLPPGTGESR